MRLSSIEDLFHVSAGPTTTTTAASKLDSILSTSLLSHTSNCFPDPSIHNRLPLFSTSNSITSPQTMDSFVHPSHISSSFYNPSFNHHTSTSNLGWMYYCTSAGSFTVQDWLKNLRLHKYSETFQGKSFNEV